ncbi:hypothetical protein M422DRAFT_56567 [Sphaerobolus stellatus SS14]|uniref:Uncharacterized protein n=1 Tax=Sphaerobolus stellatus (strain SS14) TaxID=990650 RepID=A0A0C9T5A6_SPHS4|nr:hypothetical protein M422DRAFT_56567 [Sphaerobolus stellatus SS14]
MPRSVVSLLLLLMPQCHCIARGCRGIPGGVTLPPRTYRQHQRDEAIYRRSTVKNEASIEDQTLLFERSIFQAAIIEENPIPLPTMQAESLRPSSLLTRGLSSSEHSIPKSSGESPPVSMELGQPVHPYQQEIDNLINVNANLDDILRCIKESLEDKLLGIGLPCIPILYPLKSTEELLLSYVQQIKQYNISISPVVREYANVISEGCNKQLFVIQKHKETWLSSGSMVLDMGKLRYTH